MKRTIRHLAVDIGKRVAAAFICLAMVLSTIGPWQAKAAGDKRHIVLVLDASGTADFYDSTMTQLLYSASSPMEEVKNSAMKFAEMLGKGSDDVYVSIITYGDTAYLTREFTNDYDSLKTTIQNMGQVGGAKNMSAALTLALNQLESVANDTSTKSLILVSPGMVNWGDSKPSGHWTENSTGGRWYNSGTGVKLVAYSNVAYDLAEQIKATGTKIYGIGAMRMMEDCPDSVKDVAQLFHYVLKDISSDGCFYPVYDINDFEFTFGQMTQDIVRGTDGVFDYASMNGGDYQTEYYFQDDYFEKGASEYNPSLATMTMCLAAAAFGSQVQDKPEYINAYNLLDEIDFKFIEENDDYNCEPNMNTMGTIIGFKDIVTNDGEYTLIALATRGMGYGNEWAGNFTVGETGNHQGFEAAKDVAKRHLEWYVDTYGEKFKSKVKLWMTGYSRAGATVNLLAGELTDEKCIGKTHTISFDKEDIYAYCFEPARCLSTSVCSRDNAKKYTNIHNIVNPNDFVTKLPMSEWGFIRYGVDEDVIPSMRTDAEYNKKVAKMMSFYSAIGGEAINKTFVHVSEYENQDSAVFENLVAYAKDKCWAVYELEQLNNGADNTREIRKTFEELWNTNESSYRESLADDYYIGKAISIIPGILGLSVDIDFREAPGYGIYPSAYAFRVGLSEMRRIVTDPNAGTTTSAYRLTDVVSLIDLFVLYDYSIILRSINGLVHLKNLNQYLIDPAAELGSTFAYAMNKVTRQLKNRTEYCDTIQTGVVAVCREAFKNTGELSEFELEWLKDWVENGIDTETLVRLAVKLCSVFGVSEEVGEIYDSLIEYLEEHGVDIDKILTPSEQKEFRDGVIEVVNDIIKVLNSYEGMNQLVSLAMQGSTIIYAHYPELCLSWLKSMDNNYNEFTIRKKEYKPNKLRTIYINCPVDVEAKASNGLTVAKIVDDIVKGDECVVMCGINSDGAKRMYLPTNEAYTVTITAREDCTMSFAINETNADEVCDYIENYYDIPMKKGETITVSLPREFFEDEEGNVTIIEGDNVLRSKNGTVDADVILRGDDAKAARYTVTVENGNEAGGVCSGGGVYVLGNYAMVSAAEYEDCTFLGWYEDNELVSTEREYRFSVTRDRQLSAHFEGESVYGQNGIFNATISAGENGYVVSGDKFGEEITVSSLDGYAFEVTAASKPGYEFIGWEVDGNCLISDTDAQTTEITLIDEDVTVIAKFKEYTEEGPTGQTETGDDEIVPINGVNVSYRTDSTWTGGYNGSITITNNSGRDINDWKMVFDMNGTIAGFWNAVITKNENGQYFITNSGWNGKLSKGQSITIGFTAVGNSVVAPTNFRVYEKTAQPVNTGTDPVATANVEFKTTATWNGGCNGELVITNTSGTALKNWQVTFTCTGQVNSVWNGRIVSRNGQTYVVGDDGSHSTIAPGATIRIGMNLNANGSVAYPKDFTVSGK